MRSAGKAAASEQASGFMCLFPTAPKVKGLVLKQEINAAGWGGGGIRISSAPQWQPRNLAR